MEIFAYPYSENQVLILKFDSIIIDGITATIIGAELKMEEVFSYVKIQTNDVTDEMTYEEGSCGEGVIYLGAIEKSNDDLVRYVKIELDQTIQAT